MRVFRARLKDVPQRTGGVGVSSRKEETRGQPDDVSGTDYSVQTSRTLGALPEESEAREAPNDNSGHTYGKVWPPSGGGFGGVCHLGGTGKRHKESGSREHEHLCPRII
ncbi:hypothetical protein NDU88_001599 [Pleurodeles waltl]|uniref:Uncharacterized protein n=1 Tax=Pleurodeles waltl TaxID=8319 RepID=A0AAV7U7B4_PLEWA|nr:hypothetical protein NDU88_001599 [Pleurodeles waltl]